MAVPTITPLTPVYHSTPATSFATGSLSLPAGKTLYLAVSPRVGTLANPTNVAWTHGSFAAVAGAEVDRAFDFGINARIKVYSFRNDTAGTLTGVVTATFAASTWGCGLAPAHADTDTTAPLQVVTDNDSPSDTTVELDLGALAANSNVLAFFGAASGATFQNEASSDGWSFSQDGTNSGGGGPNGSIATVYKAAGDQSIRVALNYGELYLGLALELPEISANKVVQAGAGALVLTGQAATIVGGNRVVTPGTGSLVLTGQTPSVGAIGTTSTRMFLDMAIRGLAAPSATCSHPLLIGPAYAPQTKARVTGGMDYAEFLVTNTNTSGAGSLPAAITAAKAAGGGWITIQADGHCAADIDTTNLRNITIDARLRAFTVRSLTLSDTNAGGGGSDLNGNIIICNLGLQSLNDTSRDHLQNYNVNFDFGPTLLLHCYFESGLETMQDEAVDIHMSYEKDITASWVRFKRVENSSINTLAFIIWGKPEAGAVEPEKFRMLIHHTYYQPSAANRAIDYRIPLYGGYSDTGLISGLGARLWSMNNVHYPGQNGTVVRGSSGYASLYDTFDGSFLNGAGAGDPTWTLRKDPSYDQTAGIIRIDNPRVLNGAVAGASQERNRANMQRVDTAYPHIVPCVASATHDDIVKKRSGNTLQLTITGTAVGALAGTLVGKYWDVTFPAGTVLPSSGTFDLMRSTWMQLMGSRNGYYRGSDLFSTEAQITRQSDTTIRFTVDQEPANVLEDEVFFWGPKTGIGDTFHYGTPYPALVQAGAAVTVSPESGSLVLTGQEATVSATAAQYALAGVGSLVLTGRPGTVLTTGGDTTVQPGTGSLVLAGQAATVEGAEVRVRRSLPRGTTRIQ